MRYIFLLMLLPLSSGFACSPAPAANDAPAPDPAASRLAPGSMAWVVSEHSDSMFLDGAGGIDSYSVAVGAEVRVVSDEAPGGDDRPVRVHADRPFNTITREAAPPATGTMARKYLRPLP